MSTYFPYHKLRVGVVVVVIAFTIASLGGPVGGMEATKAWAAAADSSVPKNRGLYISPLRQFISQDAGTSKTASITVGNYTDGPMVVSFSVKRFSVEDYSYNFTFDPAPSDRVQISAETIRLKPNDTRTIPYVITVPPGNPPGGQYYTIFAAGRGESGTARQQVQATSLLYLTVNGDLKRTGGLSQSGISHFVWRSSVPYSLDIANTGNIHYFVFMEATLRGPVGGSTTASETHLLLPGKTRHFESSIPSPRLPGLYTANYGYTTDTEPAVTRTSRVIYMPPWALAAIVILAWVVWIVVYRRRHRPGRQVPAGSPPGAEDDQPR